MTFFSDLSVWLSSGSGQPLSEEAVAAARGLTWSERRHSRRAVRRGEPAGSAAEGRYAVALARGSQRQVVPRWALVVVLGTALLALAIPVGDVASGELHVRDALLLLGAVYLGWLALALPRRQRGAARAESVNRELLERLGEPYVPLGSDAPADTPPLGALAGYPLLFVWYGACFGALMTVFNGKALTLANVWHRGWLYATLMTIGNAVLRHRGGSEGGRSVTSR
jgi:hypothetical protein